MKDETGIDDIPLVFVNYYKSQGFETKDIVYYWKDYTRKYVPFVATVMLNAVVRTSGQREAPEVLRLMQELSGTTLESLFTELTKLGKQ